MENEELSAFEIAGLIVQLLHGNISDDDRLKLDLWRNRDAANQVVYEELLNESTREEALHQFSNFDTDKAFDRLSQRIALPTATSHKHRIQTLIWRWSIAASIVIVLTVLFLFRNDNNPKLLTASVPMGKMIQITLPDDSKVWLNAGTTLQYPERFSDHRRAIILKEGEVFLDVMHDPDRPFVVQTRHGKISVLGTSFDISAYKNDGEEKITVSTGKVGLTVSDQRLTTFILPGERVTIGKADHSLHKSKILMEDIAAWRAERLIFDDQLLPEVMESLERKYNVTIRIENRHLLSQRINMHLNNQPLTDVLTAISFSSHLKFEVINEKLIVIR
ncbi:MAG: FecR domain-containing protein [Bacteroidetes bacterium]|nr:FecR domain-containing protein [Bacteroidota bacterium]